MTQNEYRAFMDFLWDMGENDASEGKPVEAFYDLKVAPHTERNRARYTMGYMSKKKKLKKFQQKVDTL